MRWLVEVSRVGDTAASERYCIEAKRWQAALQEARRLRGDSGALPKLTIELLDHGYRAVDPALKVRYVVTEAPPGMPVTEGAQALLTTYPPPAATESQVPAALAKAASVAPPAATGSTAPAASKAPPVGVASSLPPATSGSNRPSGGTLTVQLIRQREERPTAANPIEYREMALAVRAGASREEIGALLEARLEEVRAGLSDDHKRYVQIAVFDHSFVKRPVRPPLATIVWKDWRGDPVLLFPGFDGDKRVASDPPPAPALSTRAPSWMPSGAASVVSAAPLGPLPENLGGASTPPRPAMHAPLSPSAPVPAASAPPAGAAFVAVPNASGPIEPPRPASVIPARVVSVGPSAALPAEPAPPVALAPAPLSANDIAQQPEPTALSRQTLASAPPPSAPILEAGEVVTVSVPPASDALPAPAAAPPEELVTGEVRVAEAVQAVQAVEAPSSERALPLTRRSDPALARPSEPASARRSDPALVRRSEPSPARRRTPSEDLIGDLFESIHELAFMVDLVSGADFVVRALYDVIPCEAIIVHAFDLGRREFVVVRARGPQARNALMHRTPDADPVVREVMRRRSVVSNGASPLRSGAFEKLGTTPQRVLAAAVRQGGRYLGLIELANPLGGTPFHESEASALEYACEQFAEFVASRPIVLDEDVILGH